MSATDAERLKAGLDGDESRAWRTGAGVAGFSWRQAREFREVAAKRTILALYEEFAAEQDRQLADPACKAVGPGIRTGTEVLGQVVAALAGVYAGAEEPR